MYEDKLVTGNIEAVVDALLRARTEDNAFVWGSVPANIQAVRDDANARREKARDPRVRDQILCDSQIRCHSMGWEPDWSLGTNIYGWAVGSTLLSNLRGGRWAASARGATQEECILLGERVAERPGRIFTIHRSQLPSDVLAAYVFAKAAPFDNDSEAAFGHGV